MSARLRMSLLLFALLSLGACLSPSDPGLPGEDNGKPSDDDPPGQTYLHAASPAIYA